MVAHAAMQAGDLKAKKIRFDITLYIRSCHMLSRNIMSYIWKGVAHA